MLLARLSAARLAIGSPGHLAVVSQVSQTSDMLLNYKRAVKPIVGRDRITPATKPADHPHRLRYHSCVGRYVEFDAQYVWPNPVGDQILENLVLGSFNVEFEQVNVIMAQFGHQR